MANYNKVMLIGNLTRDPELRTTPKGNAICQFGLAVNRSFKDGEGQTREETCFVDVEAWGRTGETIAKYCTKGRPLFVEGRLQFQQWEDKNTGQKRSRLSVVLESFQFLGGREDGGGGAEGSGSRSAAASSPPRNPPPARPAPTTRPAPSDDSLDEDIPF